MQPIVLYFLSFFVEASHNIVDNSAPQAAIEHIPVNTVYAKDRHLRFEGEKTIGRSRFSCERRGRMNYLIALPPELGLSADEFAISWNELSECSEIAEASLAENIQSDLVAVEIALLSNVAEGVSSSTLGDLIRQAFHAQGITRNIGFSQQEQSDGVPLIVIRSAEE